MKKNIFIKNQLFRLTSYLCFLWLFLSSPAIAVGQPTQGPLKLNRGWQYQIGDALRNNWVSIPDISKPLYIPKGITTVWYRMKLPGGNWMSPCIYFEQIYAQSLTIYLDRQIIFQNRRNWARYDNKIMIPLGQNYPGKTVMLQTVSNINKFGTNQHIFLGNHDELMISYFLNGLVDIVLGFALALLAIILIFCCSFFMPKSLKKSWISLFLVVLILGIAEAVYPNNLSPYFPFLDQYVPILIDTLSYLFLPVLTYFFMQLFGLGSKYFILRLWQTQLIYSLLSLGLMLLNYGTRFQIDSIYRFFANEMTLLFYIAQLCALAGTAVYFALRGDVDAKIFMVGFLAFAILSSCDIIVFLAITADNRYSLWKWGLLAFVISMACILGRKIANNYHRVVTSSIVLESKNQELNSMWREVKTSRDQLADLNQTLEKRVLERTRQLALTNKELSAVNTELSTTNQKLVKTMDILQKTQAQLIESEKLAVLGQLIAGITHEINTPIGAIRASIGNISDSLNKILDDVLPFFQKLSPQAQCDFLGLLRVTLSNEPETMTTREERHLRKSLQLQLHEYRWNDSEEWSDMLATIGITDLKSYHGLFNDSDGTAIIKMVYIMTGLRRNLKIIAIAAERTAKVVFALKTYTHHSHSGEIVQADIIHGIETVLTLYQNKIKHHVSIIRNYQKIPPVWCHPDELNQVWTNIIDNALHAMNYLGVLEIDASLTNDSVIVAITDNGPGISPEAMNKIFNPFFTTKPPGEGSGMGLDIVKKIINKHHGKLEVDSIPQRTTFRIYIPHKINQENDCD